MLWRWMEGKHLPTQMILQSTDAYNATSCDSCASYITTRFKLTVSVKIFEVMSTVIRRYCSIAITFITECNQTVDFTVSNVVSVNYD